MSVSKNEKSGKWEVRTYYKDFTGVRKQKTKRGFEKKSDAIAWERSFHLQQDENLDMYFKDFVEIYIRDKKPRVKYNTWLTKEYIIENKILPYFGNKKVSEIKTSDVLQWQNEIMNQQTKTGKKYSKTYLKTIHNQLSAILNHACNMYGLKVNMARRAGNMGIEEHKEMLFWTQEEYQTFIEAVADKEESYIAFEILYWCGIRLGELLALTPADFDFENCKLRINKSFQRLQGKNVITSPKTPKSNRVIYMPEFLAEEVKDYLTRLYGIEDNDRIFEISKSFLHHEMDRGVRLTGVKRIRIHDLRHSHVSLLINMGYSALAIGDRVGHEAIAITYRYAHLFPSIQSDMAVDLNRERASMVGFEPDVKRGKADIIDVREKERRKEQMAKPYNRFSVVTGGRSRA
ncbi:AP2-like DNA-binding integrase domain-containing protein [Pseudobutyrivibrio sp. UC1225]|uniref:site-specific integrase n=1 Tax=Pseudobutyrivibrio sp. UC1225 TaxID=1798185 RepID=UPI0008DFEA0A|nr:site-specific integrase [Pseudobutyrivibrio sp. UC1225]SFN61523.1 AP2-like DNA-binding integrase domain-containing protein [Pseudobutyrivibrio sp. UC1225]